MEAPHSREAPRLAQEAHGEGDSAVAGSAGQDGAALGEVEVKWLTENTAPGYGALYVSGRYRIRHYTEPTAIGFGISCARAYLDGEQIGEFTGEAALDQAMAACARHVGRAVA